MTRKKTKKEELEYQISRENKIVEWLILDEAHKARERYKEGLKTLREYFNDGYRQDEAVEAYVEETLDRVAQVIDERSSIFQAFIGKVAAEVDDEGWEREAEIRRQERVQEPLSYERWLRWLDLDRDKAGQRELEIRKMLGPYFTRYGCLDPERLVDKTIVRTIQIIDRGKEVEVGSPPTRIIIVLEKEVAGKRQQKLIDVEPEAYIRGVAKRILQEYFLEQQAHPFIPIDGLAEGRVAGAGPQGGQAAGDKPARSKPMPDDKADDEDLKCLRQCLEKLDREERELILQFHDIDKKIQADKKIRHKLQEEALGLSNDQLRIRAFHIRKTLKKCVEDCRKTPETAERK